MTCKSPISTMTDSGLYCIKESRETYASTLSLKIKDYAVSKLRCSRCSHVLSTRGFLYAEAAKGRNHFRFAPLERRVGIYGAPHSKT